MKRLLAVSALLCSACAQPEADPARVVTTYLRSLGGDPLRAIACVTATFPERTGLRLATSAEVLRWRERVREGAAAPAAPAPPATPPSPEEAQVSWLSVQVKPAFREALGRLRWQVSGERRDDDRHATVTATIEPEAAPPFQQVFQLTRQDGSGPWRIDRVEQIGVGEANLAEAFVTNPTEELRRRLAERLGVPAD